MKILLKNINHNEMNLKSFGLMSGSTIKIIAIASMLLDHIGAFLVYPYYMDGGTLGNADLYEIYLCMRIVGRIACPLFMFCIIEGVENTKNPMKYFGLMALFAIISEMPFDLAVSGKIMAAGDSNIFFTLLAGVGVLLCLRAVFLGDDRINLYVICPVTVFAIIFCHVAKADYGGIGICAITLGGMCSMMNSQKLQLQKNFIVIAAITLLLLFIGGIERYEILCVPIALLYNGKRGLKLKYFFYIFYPAHLLLLYIMRVSFL